MTNEQNLKEELAKLEALPIGDRPDDYEDRTYQLARFLDRLHEPVYQRLISFGLAWRMSEENAAK